ncbi:MAG: NAD(P)H-hydrate dehydratase [archaeon]|nr:NAD(P)H-hydrate dehydratase [archaeon]
MRKLIEFQILDQNAEKQNFDLSILMNNAGTKVANHIIDNYNNTKIVTIVCGNGNNGGDGYVIANILIENGFQVNVLNSGLPKSSAANRALSNLQCDIIPLEDLGKFKDSSDILLDCLLGSGIKGEIRSPLDEYISLMNGFSLIISVDVPSGFGTKNSIIPDKTLTFHDFKTNMKSKNSGEIILLDINFPAEIDSMTGPGELLLYPDWNTSNRKGENGKVAIVGGGPFSGAPSLAALGSYRSGSDLVHVFVPENSYEAVSKFIPELIVHKLNGEQINPHNIEDLFNYDFDSVVIGPGMGKDSKSFAAVQILIDNYDNVVIDADAINLYNFSSKNIVLTPHKGEIERLEIRPTKDAMNQFALENNITLVLKGETDFITNGEYFKHNKTGHPRMAVGGTGDVLAGFLGTLLAKGLSGYEAGRLACYSLGLAGERSYDEIGSGFLPTDLAVSLSKVLKKS